MANISIGYPNGYKEVRPSEIVNGVKIPKMAARPSHQNTAANMWRIFREHFKGGSCRVYMDTFVFLEDDEKYIPDVAVVCDPSKIDPNKGIFGAPDLVAEVLSASTKKRDKGHKKEIYEKHGVKEYWLVDVAGQAVEVYLLHEGSYYLSNVYELDFPEHELEDMSEEDRAMVSQTFKTSLFDDLIIDVRDIFED